METSILSPEPVNKSEITNHKLHDKWTLWAHLPHDTDWTVKSYKKIMTFSTVEEALVLYETLPEKMIKNCMLFLMRDGIQPMEDVKNRDGGCFSQGRQQKHHNNFKASVIFTCRRVSRRKQNYLR